MRVSVILALRVSAHIYVKSDLRTDECTEQAERESAVLSPECLKYRLTVRHRAGADITAVHIVKMAGSSVRTGL